MKKITALILLIIASNLFAQMDKSKYYSFGTQYYLEHHVLPSSSTDSIEVSIIYKIMNDALTFTKDISDASLYEYRAFPKIEVSFTDDTGIIRQRAFLNDSVIVTDYDKTNSKTEFHSGVLNVTLATNDYTAKASYYENKNELFKTDIQIKGKDYYSEDRFSSPIFAYKTSESKESYIPMGRDNKLRFNVPNSFLLFLAAQNQSYDAASFVINKQETDDVNYWDNDFKFSGKPEIAQNSFPVFISGDHEFELNTIDKVGDVYFSTFVIKLPSEQLTPGMYDISINSDGKEIHSTEFEVIWPDMPLALDNPKYAVNMMYYILTDEEYDKMDDGDPEEKIAKIKEYWKEKDPTPRTPYNEAMVEYFERVDYAFFNFQTIQERDGAKTQRGKIYILYGEPDEIETKLQSNNTIEVWTYNRINKQFIFEITSPGVYELTEQKTLEQ